MAIQWDPAWLDSMYNNRERVRDCEACRRRWGYDSVEAMRSQACVRELVRETGEAFEEQDREGVVSFLPSLQSGRND